MTYIGGHYNHTIHSRHYSIWLWMNNEKEGGTTYRRILPHPPRPALVGTTRQRNYGEENRKLQHRTGTITHIGGSPHHCTSSRRQRLMIATAQRLRVQYESVLLDAPIRTWGTEETA